ncbi:MAG: choice-of-anchor D domain-containing protein, partial [Nevskiaceae bacterium]
LSGAAAADYSVANPCRQALAKNQVCVLAVTFKPTATGSRAATLDIATSDKALAVSLSGSVAAAAAKISLTPASLSFGAQAILSSSATQKLTLSNTGTAEFNLGPLLPSGKDPFDFTVKHDCGKTLAGGKSCEISVTFSPRTPGDKAGAVVISGAAIGAPATARFTGTANGPRLATSAPRIAFEEQAVGSSSAAKTVKVSNQGNAALSFTKITLAGPDATHFVQTNTCSSALAPGADCNISIVYKPTTEGPKLAVLSLEGNFASAAATVGIVADGKRPMQGGLWRGNDPFSGKPLVGLIAENRQALFLLQDGSQYFGPAAVKDERFSAMLAVANANGVQGGVQIQATIKNGNSINGKATLAPKSGNPKSGDLSLAFDTLYTRGSSLAKAAGNYKNVGSGAVININATGVLFSQEDASGCVINGSVAVIDSRFNAYATRLSFSGCKGDKAALNGTNASGLMFIDDTTSPAKLSLGVQNPKPGYALTLSASKL